MRMLWLLGLWGGIVESAYGSAAIQSVPVDRGTCITEAGSKRDGEAYYDTANCLKFVCDADAGILEIYGCPPLDDSMVDPYCTVSRRGRGLYPKCCEPLIACT